mmetsp:Transcript_10111/g.29932  ORF Transcript_10111/g.29932 Transcript_10111/m.29932 type:complete len:315 (+) Transcript_10111:712-1656(+)
MLLMQSMMPLSSSPAISSCTSGGETSIAFWMTRQPYILFESFSTSPLSWPTTAFRSSAVPISRRRWTTWHPEASLESCPTSGSTASQRALRLEGLPASRRAWINWLPCMSRASSPTWSMISLSERSHLAPSRRASRRAALHAPVSPPAGAWSRLPPLALRPCCLPPWASVHIAEGPVPRGRQLACAIVCIADGAVSRFGYMACATTGLQFGGTMPGDGTPEASIGRNQGLTYMPPIGCICSCCICCGMATGCCTHGGYCANGSCCTCGGNFPRPGLCRSTSAPCWGPCRTMGPSMITCIGCSISLPMVTDMGAG